jgi:hypothetical protein
MMTQIMPSYLHAMLEVLRPRGPFARQQRVLHVDVLPIAGPWRRSLSTFPAQHCRLQIRLHS